MPHKNENERKSYFVQQHKKKSLGWMQEETEFSKNKHKYSDRIIKYDSPNGLAYVGIAKSPLMKNESGFGFKGVLLQSDNRALIQCSECGRWMKRLERHIARAHGMSPQEYKDKYELNRQQPLMSDVQKNYQAILIDKHINSRGLNGVNTEEARHSQKKKVNEYWEKVRSGEIKHNRTQKENRYGTCPEQLKALLLDSIHRFKCIPSYKKQFPKMTQVRIRYGSFNNFLQMYGLPTRNRIGGKTEYLFTDGQVIYTTNFTDNTGLYELLLQKCPVLNGGL